AHPAAVAGRQLSSASAPAAVGSAYVPFVTRPAQRRHRLAGRTGAGHRRAHALRVLPLARPCRTHRSAPPLSPCLAQAPSAGTASAALASRRQCLGHGLRRSASTDRRPLRLPPGRPPPRHRTATVVATADRSHPSRHYLGLGAAVRALRPAAGAENR